MTLEEKKAKLAELNKKFSKSYGEKGQVRTANNLEKVNFYSTGIMGIDLALNGGVAVGRVMGISGTFSSAKTTLALMTIAEQQRKDPTFYAYYYDAEQSLDVQYASDLGVDMERLIVDQTKVAEEGLTKLRDSIDSGVYGIAVLDSTSALNPSKNVEEEITSVSMALVARILGNAYPQLAGVCAKNDCALIVIEQIRKSLVAMGNPEVTSKGETGKFTFSQQVMMRRQTKVEEEDGLAVSNEVTFKVTKNKVGVPYRKCSVVCRYGEGIDKITDLVRASVQLGSVSKSGAWFYYPNKESCTEDHKWQGEESFCNYLKSHEEFKDKLYEETLNIYKNADSKTVMQDEDETDKINAQKEELEDLKVTSNENDTLSQDSKD